MVGLFNGNTSPPPQTKYEGALHSCLYNLHSKHFCGFQHSSSYPLYLLKELLQVIIIQTETQLQRSCLHGVSSKKMSTTRLFALTNSLAQLLSPQSNIVHESHIRMSLWMILRESQSEPVIRQTSISRANRPSFAGNSNFLQIKPGE